MLNLIKSNFCRLLVRIRFLEEAAVHVVSLLLDDSTKLHQLVGNRLVGTLEDVDETVSHSLAFSVLKMHQHLNGLLTIQSAPCPGL